MSIKGLITLTSTTVQCQHVSLMFVRYDAIKIAQLFNSTRCLSLLSPQGHVSAPTVRQQQQKAYNAMIESRIDIAVAEVKNVLATLDQ